MFGRRYDFGRWLPKASCVCITYGRPHLIGEAVESFLRQDYPGEKELIILNDHPEVRLEMGRQAGVTLVNHPDRYPSIGVKRNAATVLSSGDVILPWDDDDISLPWRISLSLEQMANRHYFKPGNMWWWDGSGVEHKRGVMAHAMSAYSRELFDRLGGYPDFNSGEDQKFEAGIAGLGLHDVREIPRSDAFYIYRMEATDTYHLSYYAYGGGLDRCEEVVGLKYPAGDYGIDVGWGADYVGKCSAASGEPGPPPGGLSICVSLKDRSSVPHANSHLQLFPNCVRSIAEAGVEIGDLEIVVADFGSRDWPPGEWLEREARDVPTKAVDVGGAFSRGRGLNRAAEHASHENLLLCDADLLLDAGALCEGLRCLARGKAFFPVVRMLAEDGEQEDWCDHGYGIAFVTKAMLRDAGGVAEFESWGGEDDLLYGAVSEIVPVERRKCGGIRHQWHPEKCRHENYRRGRRVDFDNTQSRPPETGRKRIDCYVFEGLCNRINGIASAMATGLPVRLHWSLNAHCPVGFAEVFGQLDGIEVFEEQAEAYPYVVKPTELCWFYPRNISGLERKDFRERIYAAYKSLLEAAFALVPECKSDGVLGIHYRHYLDDVEGFDQFVDAVKPTVESFGGSSVFVASDSQRHKDDLCKVIGGAGISTVTNTTKLLAADLDRGRDSVMSLLADLRSMAACTRGVITNSTRSSVVDSLRAFGVRAYHTFDDGFHRHGGRDDLFEHEPLRSIGRELGV